MFYSGMVASIFIVVKHICHKMYCLAIPLTNLISTHTPHKWSPEYHQGSLPSIDPGIPEDNCGLPKPPHSKKKIGVQDNLVMELLLCKHEAESSIPKFPLCQVQSR